MGGDLEEGVIKEILQWQVGGLGQRSPAQSCKVTVFYGQKRINTDYAAGFPKANFTQHVVILCSCYFIEIEMLFF